MSVKRLLPLLLCAALLVALCAVTALADEAEEPVTLEVLPFEATPIEETPIEVTPIDSDDGTDPAGEEEAPAQTEEAAAVAPETGDPTVEAADCWVGLPLPEEGVSAEWDGTAWVFTLTADLDLTADLTVTGDLILDGASITGSGKLFVSGTVTVCGDGTLCCKKIYCADLTFDTITDNDGFLPVRLPAEGGYAAVYRLLQTQMRFGRSAVTEDSTTLGIRLLDQKSAYYDYRPLEAGDEITLRVTLTLTFTDGTEKDLALVIGSSVIAKYLYQVVDRDYNAGLYAAITQVLRFTGSVESITLVSRSLTCGSRITITNDASGPVTLYSAS